MARERDFKKEYVRREEIAKAKGYQSYYDYRLHGHGKTPPTAPRIKGRIARRLAGRESPNKLYARLAADEVEMISPVVTNWDPPQIDVQITLTDGSTEEYKIKGSRAAQAFFDETEDIDIPDTGPSPNALSSLQSRIG